MAINQHQSSMTMFIIPFFNDISITFTCSAGAGRTGTLIALDIALEQLKSERGVDISGIINKMRGQRMKMVQSAVSLHLQ